ncbi:MAG: ABC transporter substrate-binding protein [Acidimicrobiales bacterium]
MTSSDAKHKGLGLRLLAALVLFASVAGCGTMLKESAFSDGEGTTRRTVNQGAAGSGGGATAGSTIPGQAGAGGTDATAGSAGGGAADPTGSGGQAATGPNQASDTGVTETAIKVGNITAVNGALGPDAFSPLLRGSKLFFQAVNESGGINGRKVDFESCDDAENPNQDKSCAQKLIEGSGVFAMVGGSTDTFAAASYINGKGVPDIGYPIGNAYYKYPNLFAILGAKGYPRDGSAVGVNGTAYVQTGVYRHFKNQVGVSKAAVLYYSIAISKTAGDFIAKGLDLEGIPVAYTPGGGSGIIPTQQSYDSDVIAMRDAGVDGIWNAIDIAGFQKLCLAMDRNSFTVKANVSTVQGWSQKVGRDFSAPCRNSIYANALSVPYSQTSDPNIAAITDAAARYDPQGYLHQWVVDGWAGGKLLADAVSSMGPAPTRTGVVSYINALRDYTYGGLMAPVDWRPSFDFSAPSDDCFSLGRWDDGAGTFVNALGGDTFQCAAAPWYGYVPVDDGS